jgi:hypothetical protein
MKFITINHDPFIVKYLRSKFGDVINVNDDKIFPIPVTSFIGIVPNQLSLFEEKKKKYYKNSQTKIIVDTIPGTLPYINEFSESFFCDFFDNLFINDLHQFVTENSKAKRGDTGYMICIEKFLKKFGIEIDEDISFETIKKKYYRYRKTLDASGGFS